MNSSQRNLIKFKFTKILRRVFDKRKLRELLTKKPDNALEIIVVYIKITTIDYIVRG